MKKSIEELVWTTGSSISDPFSRRVFLKLSSAAGLSLAAAPLSPAAWGQDAAKGKVAQQVATLANDYWGAWTKGFEATAAALGIDSQQFFHNNDAAKEISQVRGLPATGTNMLVGTVAAAGELPMVARLCQENEIYYAPTWEIPPWFTPPDVGDYFVTFMTPPSDVAAYESSKALFESIGGSGKVVHIKGLVTPVDDARTAGLLRAAAEFPEIEIVGGLRGDWIREGARTVMLSMVTAHPDMKAVFAQNDSMGLGAISVLRERGLDAVKVAGVDGLPEGLEEVAKGGQFVATHTSLPPYQAGFAIVAAFDALNGWKPRLPERLLYTGSLLATAENAESILNRVYKTDAPPFDWVKMSRTLTPDSWNPQNVITPIDPQAHWGGTPEGKEKLNPAYLEPGFAAELEAVRKLYADHYVSGPFL